MYQYEKVPTAVWMKELKGRGVYTDKVYNTEWVLSNIKVFQPTFHNFDKPFKLIFNRPGVAGAVLQTPA